MRFLLLSLLVVTGLCFASGDVDVQGVVAALPERELAVTLPATTVPYAKNTVGIQVMQIRDISWPASITFDPNSYYELVPEQYFDKVSIREVKLGKLDYAFRLFCPIIPRQWNPASGNVVLTSLDAFDALVIGTQAASPAIVQAALQKLPYTKSVLMSGKTTDFLENKPFMVNGKFKVDLYIELICDSMTTKINTGRVNKFLSPVYAIITLLSIKGGSSIAAPILSRVTQGLFNELLEKTPVKSDDMSKACSTGTTVTSDKKQAQAPEKATSGAEAQKDTPSLLAKHSEQLFIAGASVISALIAHYLQHVYVDGYIKILDLLVSSDVVIFDRAVTYTKVKALKEKLQWFGSSNSRVERMQEILDKI